MQPINNSNDDIQTEIPKTIYICHKNLNCLHTTYKFWKQLNPNYQIKLFNDVMCQQFLLDKFSEIHQSVFNFIPDGPIKSDFWRICILYTYGGIYVDADIHPFVPLDKYFMCSCDFVTCITKSNGNFNPHFIAARKNDNILKKCIDEYIEFYIHRKQSYTYWDWSIVNIFNKFLSHVKNEYNKTPKLQVFYIENKKYQIFFETTSHDDDDLPPGNKSNNFNITTLIPRGLHDYYCTFLNKRIFNTRYLNYDPDEHTFKNHIVKNRKQNHNVIAFNLNVNLSKLSNMKILKKI